MTANEDSNAPPGLPADDGGPKAPHRARGGRAAGLRATPGDAAHPIDPDVHKLALSTLNTNLRLNWAARVIAMFFCVSAGIGALVYVIGHADAMIETLRVGGASQAVTFQLFALTVPALLLTILAGLAGLAATMVHSRGLDETYRTLDTLNRLRREGEVAVSSRGLIVAFEEKIRLASRAFSLLLLFGRTLFVVCLGLFAAALVNAIVSGVDVLTLTLGVTSVAGVLLAVVLSVPNSVTHQLANVIQLQSIVTGFHRQLSLLESEAFTALNDEHANPLDVHQIVLSVQDRIASVVKTAVEQIENFADSDGRARRSGAVSIGRSAVASPSVDERPAQRADSSDRRATAA